MALYSPSFFKVIVHKNLVDKKVMIPKNFIKEYGMLLSSPVSLELPDGLVWKVGLTISPNGTVWLQNGWHEFSVNYGLEFGSFLVFILDGNSIFKTTIFDKNGSGIKYSCCKEEDDENPSFLLPVPKKMRKEGSFRLPKKEPEEARDNGRSRPRPHNALNSEEHVGPRGHFFERTMKKWSNRIIYIPGNMLKDLKISMRSKIVLQDENGKLWPTSIRCTSQNRISITTGWSIFYRGHNLREDDKCEYEFVLGSGNVCGQINVKVKRGCRRFNL